MNGVRRIAHQRQSGLDILQRMPPGERKGAGRLRRYSSQPRRKVTGDLLLELRHGHALQLTDPRWRVVPDQRGPAVEQRQEGARPAGVNCCQVLSPGSSAHSTLISIQDC